MFPAIGRDGEAVGKLPPGDAAAAGRAQAGQEGQGGRVQLHTRVKHWQQWRHHALMGSAEVEALACFTSMWNIYTSQTEIEFKLLLVLLTK